MAKGKGMIAVVTGGRNNYAVPTIEGTLADFHAGNPFVLLYEGGAGGADSVASRWAKSRGVPVNTIRAEWSRHGPGAGPIRNGTMLRAALANADEYGVGVTLFAFAGGKGTADCKRQARGLGIRVIDSEGGDDGEG